MAKSRAFENIGSDSASILLSEFAVPDRVELADPRRAAILESHSSSLISKQHQSLGGFNQTPTVEEPKVAFSQNKLKACLGCLVHLPSIAITLGVLSLSWRSVFWQAQGPNTNSVLNALQFAAKIHESFIVLSLVAILLHRIRYDLCGPQGVPFGLLTSASQIHSVTSLMKLQIFHGLNKGWAMTSRHLQLAVLVLVLSILAAVAGPLAAIAILPRLERWPYDSNDVSLSFFLNTSALFPNTLTSDLFPSDCLGSSAYTSQSCPLGGFRVVQGVFASLSQLITQGDPFQGNISMPISDTFPQAGAFRYINGGYLEIPDSSSSIIPYTASSPIDVLTTMLWAYANHLTPFFMGNSIPDTEAPSYQMSLPPAALHAPIQKPLVQALCQFVNLTTHQASKLTTEQISFPHETLQLPPYNQAPLKYTNWSLPLSQFQDSFDTLSDGPAFRWIDLGLPGKTGPSIAALWLSRASNLGYEVDNNTQTVAYACSIDARWMPSDIWAIPSSDSLIHETIYSPPEFLAELYESTSTLPEYPIITLESAWADALNVVDTSTTQNQTAMQEFLTMCISNSTNALEPELFWDYYFNLTLESCLTQSLAFVITDGLSRIGNNLEIYELICSTKNVSSCGSPMTYSGNFNVNVTQADLLDPTKFSQLTVSTTRYGYGYSFNTVTIHIAAAFLLLHIVIALIHMIIVLAGGWNSNAWGVTADFVALAMNSTPTTLLKNTGVGCDKAATWKKVVRVRQRNGENLELVFSDLGERVAANDGDDRPRADKKYS